MLIKHPTIYLDASGARTDAVLIRDGRVAAIGDEARQVATGDDRTVTPGGECLFPALGDAHVHLWGFGLRAGTVDLRGMDADKALGAIADAAPGDHGWVLGANLDEHQFKPNQQISRRDLDALFPNTPVCIHRVDRHAAWVNSAALRLTDFERRYTPTEAGHVARGDDGRPTGRLVDAAAETLAEAIPAPSLDEDRQVFLRSARRLRQLGIGFCTIAYCSVRHLQMLTALADEGELPVDVDVLVDGRDPDFQQFLDDGPVHRDKLRAAGVKFFADGALGSAGAHLLEPYRTGGTGLQMHEEGFLQRQIPKLMEDHGLQVAVHAIGDAAAREVLDAFEQVSEPVRNRLRPRLEHAQLVAPQDQPRFAELDVIASIQPIHLRSDAPWAAQKLNDDQLARLFPWTGLKPATFAAGSDYPIDDINPWHGIATAITRRGSDGKPFRPDDALSRGEILRAYTAGAAFASHREDELGQLREGFRAEVIALDVDPFEASPEAIWEMDAELVSVSGAD